MNTRPIRDFVTRAPFTIGKSQTLNKAHELMRAHAVRHLPVLEGGKLVGLVSQRDLYFLETLRDVDPGSVLVEEAMTREPFTVPPGTSLARVARAMVRGKLGAALVVERGKVVGIFTAIDALRVLAGGPAQAAPARRAGRRQA
jgi:acetoin utilization protein AcuB